MKKSKTCKNAFTLAEVLITLGVIGVVAAITLPSLIHNIRAHILKNQFKTAYSIISQAYTLVKVNTNNDSIYSTYTVYDPARGYYLTNEFKKEMYKNLKVIGDLTNCPEYSTYSSRDIKLGNGNGYVLGLPNKILANGMYIHINIGSNGYTGRQIGFLIDINGDKGPNRFGHDLFKFTVKNSSDIVTGEKMIRLYTDEEIENMDKLQGFAGLPCSINSKQNTNGFGCAWYAINNICPDNENRGYWDCLPR